MLYKKDQSSTFEYITRFLSNKVNLFLVISLTFGSSIVYFFLIPHLTHTSMVYHVLIHIVSLDISIFLTIISLLSYNKTRSNRILLTFFSFVFLVAIEILYLLEASNFLRIFYIPLIEIDFSHILLTCMIILFAWGVLKVDKKH